MAERIVLPKVKNADGTYDELTFKNAKNAENSTNSLNDILGNQIDETYTPLTKFSSSSKTQFLGYVFSKSIVRNSSTIGLNNTTFVQVYSDTNSLLNRKFSIGVKLKYDDGLGHVAYAIKDLGPYMVTNLDGVSFKISEPSFLSARSDGGNDGAYINISIAENTILARYYTGSTDSIAEVVEVKEIID